MLIDVEGAMGVEVAVIVGSGVGGDGGAGTGVGMTVGSGVGDEGLGTAPL